MLPNYLIVGAAKSGTNTLAHYLNEHPEAFIVPQKEVNYFAADEIKNQQLYYKDYIVNSLEDYKKLFETAEAYRAVGEGSTSYLFYETVPEKIKQLIPEVKIIILLRNPVDRTYSHYLMDKRIGLVDLPLIEILKGESKHEKQKLYYQQFVELSLYFEQVNRYINTFSSENVKICIFENLIEDTENTLRDIFQFLNIDARIRLDFDAKFNSYNYPNSKIVKILYKNYFVRKGLSALIPSLIQKGLFSAFFDSKKPKLDEEAREILQAEFANDINKLEESLNIDLSRWK